MELAAPADLSTAHAHVATIPVLARPLPTLCGDYLRERALCVPLAGGRRGQGSRRCWPRSGGPETLALDISFFDLLLSPSGFDGEETLG